MSEEEWTERKEDVLLLYQDFKPSSQTGEFRCPNASSYGGWQQLDAEKTSRVRGALGEFLKALGKKIYAGDFNLTRTSFPIKCMAPNS